MKKLKLLIAFLLVMNVITVNAQLKGVFSIDGKALEKNKERISAMDPLIIPAYKKLLKDADKAMNFEPVSVMDKKNDPPSGDKHDYMSLAPYNWPDPSKPNGLPYIRKDGQTNPEVKDYKDKDYMPKLCEAVNTLGLAYYFSGENKYAEHATQLLRVWFLDKATAMNPNLNYAQAIKGVNEGRGAGLIDARHFIKLIDGIALINDSKTWTASDQQGMKQWFTDFLNWMQTSKNGIHEMNAKNNHGAWYDALRLSIALYIDNTGLAKKIVLNAESRLDSQMDDNGNFPLELERTTSLHYTGFAIQAFFLIAQMSEKTGMDFWHYTSPSGKSLRKAFNTYAPYISKEKVWTGQQIKDFDFEEGYPLLAQGAKQFDCKKYFQTIKNIAGDDAANLRLRLLTDFNF